MARIKTLDDLKQLREDLIKNKRTKVHAGSENLVQIKVAMATCGIASGARQTMDFLSSALEKRNIDADVRPTGCMSYCYAEPTIEITLPGKQAVVFGWVDVQKADEIIERYIKEGEPVEGIIPVNYQTIN